MTTNIGPQQQRWTRAIRLEAQRIAATARSNTRGVERRVLGGVDAVRAEAFRIAEVATDPKYAERRAELKARAARLSAAARRLRGGEQGLATSGSHGGTQAIFA